MCRHAIEHLLRQTLYDGNARAVNGYLAVPIYVLQLSIPFDDNVT